MADIDDNLSEEDKKDDADVEAALEAERAPDSIEPPEAGDSPDSPQMDIPDRAPAVMPEGPPQAPAPAAPLSVQQYIAQRVAEQQQALQGAQAQAAGNQQTANITEGLGQIVSGLSGQKTFDPSSYNYLHEQANNPVKNLIAQQTGKLAALKGIGEESSVESNVEASRPDSVVSTVARRGLQSVIQAAGGDPSIVDGMNANQVKEMEPLAKNLISLKESGDKIKAAQALKEMTIVSTQILAKTKYAEIGQKNREMAETKSNNQQNQALQSTMQLLESARGNPAAAQAERDIYAGQKANSLANLYGDPNKLSPQQVQLLASEVAKMASGGVPSTHELQGLNPSTFPKAFAEVAQKFTNSPSSANAGAFIKGYQDYADALTKDARQVIEDKYGRVIETNKNRVGPENYQTLKDNYLGRFPKADAQAKQKSSSPQYQSGDLVNVKGRGTFSVGADGETLTPVPK